jgi:hypothetical protein
MLSLSRVSLLHWHISSRALHTRFQDIRENWSLICYGLCEDSISAFTQEHFWALSVLGPQLSLTGDEAIAFFPTFFEVLSGLCAEDIDPVRIRDALKKTNRPGRE